MFLIVTIVFVATVAAYEIALKAFPKLELLDFPERYGLSRPRLPYPAGIVAVCAFIITVLLTTHIDQKSTGMLIGVIALAIVSFVDDRTPLPSRLRFIMQVFVALLIFAEGSRIYTITSPFGGILKLDAFTLSVPYFGSLPILSGFFTVGWLLLTINALNWFDGVSGQVSVIAMIGFAMLGLLALLRNGESDIALIAFSLSAIALAGSLFDVPPAKMLMGDTGSMFFGLMLGLLGVYHGGKVATAFLALGIPLLDALFVVAGRIMRKQSPFKGGRDHLHHRLLARGWSERQIVCLTAGIGIVFGGGALFLDTAQKAIAGLVLVTIVALLHLWLGKSKNTI